VITLATTGDYLVVFAIAAIAGLVGGLASELLLNHNGETGEFELPSRKGGFFDLGGFATLLVGAVVGVAILIVFPPQTTILANSGGGTTITQSYDTVRLVATSLVAGSAGGSVLTALQARVVAAVNESKIQFAVAAGQQQVDQLAQNIKAQAVATIASVSAGAGQPAAGQPGAVARGAFADPLPGGGPAADPEAAMAALSTSIDDQAARARAALAAVVRGPSS